MTDIEMTKLASLAEKPTRGNWFVVEYEGGALTVHSSEEMRVCFMATAGSHGDPERIEADAHLIAACDPQTITALIERVRIAERLLLALATAADDVGVRHFDTDTMEPEVLAMQEATVASRAYLRDRG